MKRIVSMQDLSCMGKCSLTVALPIYSAMGIECAVLPTAVLSTHTAFPKPAVVDLSRHIDAFLDHWSGLSPAFSGISIGYLATPEQCRHALDLMDRFGKDAFICVDPAMADHGKLYSGLQCSHVEAMKTLCARADLILPNITEGAMLTGTAYDPQGGEDYCRELVDKLLLLGCKSVILTGFRSCPGQIGYIGRSAGGSFFSCQREELPRSCHGTGDLFAAVIMGGVMRGMDLSNAGELACDMVRLAIETTPEDSRYGVAFEHVIPQLIASLHSV